MPGLQETEATELQPQQPQGIRALGYQILGIPEKLYIQIFM